MGAYDTINIPSIEEDKVGTRDILCYAFFHLLLIRLAECWSVAAKIPVYFVVTVCYFLSDVHALPVKLSIMCSYI